MRLYLDTEFTALELGAQLMSLALVDEAGFGFYAEFIDYDRGTLSDWHKANVLPGLLLDDDRPGEWPEYPNLVCVKASAGRVRTALEQFLAQYDKVDVWGDNHAYDWVLFCELWGGALHIPANINYLVPDLVTLLFLKGQHPDTPRQRFAELAEMPAYANTLLPHNALYDALLLRNAVEYYLR